MQVIKEKLDIKKLEECLKKENTFITDLLELSCIPERKDSEVSDNEDDETNPNSRYSSNMNHNKASRATSLIELQQRLDAIRGKKKQTYKEKLTKKGLKNRLKKKTQQDQRNAEKKLQRATKLNLKTEAKGESIANEENSVQNINKKPVFNKDDKIVFSKIEFENIGKHRKVKQEKDPKKLLKKLEEQQENIQKLKESGDTEKAIEIKEKSQWKNALAKAEGQKVKDDPHLLMKSVKKQEQKQRSSKKKWDNRQEKVEKAKKERQQKRTDNIQKRKKDNKNKKLKKAVKRGKVIPGF